MNKHNLIGIALLATLISGCHTTDKKAAPAGAENDTSVAGIQKTLLQQEEFLKKDSLNPEAWYQKGLLHAEMKDTSNAIKALETSFSLQPLQSTGLTLAELYAETKNARALELCNAILKKDSTGELTEPLFIKGIYYSRSGNNQEALKAFEACILRDWKFTEAYMEKGMILYNEKKLPEALKIFQLAATVTNTYADAYFWIGKCYEASGQKKEALDNYSKAVALDKDFTEAREAVRRINIL